MPKLLTTVLLLAVLALGAALVLADGSDRFAREVRPVLERHCFSCHDEKEREGDLALTRFRDETSVRDARRAFLEVIARVEKGEMPPDERPRPSEEDRRSIVDGLRRILGGEAAPGVTIRRLNRAEYDNTVRDLLGVDLRPSEEFPLDDRGYGFDNIADVLTVSPLLLERYLGAAERVLDAALVIEEPVRRETRSYAGGELPSTRGGRPAGGAHFLTSNGTVYADHEFAVGGKYVIQVTAWGQQAGPEPAKMAISVDGKVRKTFAVKAVRGKPGVYRQPVELAAGRHRIGAAFVNDYYRPRAADPSQRDRNLAIEAVEIDGPFGRRPEPKPRSHRRVFFCSPRPGLGERACARRILRRFARRAFRRPVEDAEVERLVELYDRTRAEGLRFEEGVQRALLAVLVSPRFLYRIERGTPDGGLTDHELATRLSYFLWSSMPDEKLDALADAGRLGEDRVLAVQVDRMLGDPKARALTENFAGQWLELRRLDLVRPDANRFPAWSDELRDSMRRETELFFEHVMRRDRSVLEFLDADYTFLDERLAKHYGIDGVEGEGFRRVVLANPVRGGLLTHASVLTVTSYPTRTSPVLRGKWVLEQILGTPPPPPPADVPSLDEGPEAEADAPVRERMRRHREDPICASCHKDMDPLGFALENFDAIGRWREKDGPFPVDASGRLPDGAEFDGAAELKDVLMKRRSGFVRALAEKLSIYALGRGLVPGDAAMIDEIRRGTEEADHRFSALIRGVVLSDAFRSVGGGGAR